MNILILYLTRDGQTKKIADKLTEHFASGQNPPKVCNLSLREHNEISYQELAEFDLIILGASIRYGRFDPILEKFIQRHSSLLNQKTSAFFSVNLTARKLDKNTPETNAYTYKLLRRILWKPTLVQVFAGALLYPRYRFFDRIMIQLIMRLTGGEIDSTKEIEYTDWQSVQNFSERLLKYNENR